MIYVSRGSDGRVVSASLRADETHVEAVSRGDPSVAEFVRQMVDDEALADSDLRLVRVLEDLIDLLIGRELIRFTDLPGAAQRKLMERRSMRESKGALDLLSDSNELL